MPGGLLTTSQVFVFVDQGKIYRSGFHGSLPGRRKHRGEPVARPEDIVGKDRRFIDKNASAVLQPGHYMPGKAPLPKIHAGRNTRRCGINHILCFFSHKVNLSEKGRICQCIISGRKESQLTHCRHWLFVLYLSQSAALRRSRIVEKITSERKEISDYGG